jgi:hypothetical protein
VSGAPTLALGHSSTGALAVLAALLSPVVCCTVHNPTLNDHPSLQLLHHLFSATLAHWLQVRIRPTQTNHEIPIGEFVHAYKAGKLPNADALRDGMHGLDVALRQVGRLHAACNTCRCAHYRCSDVGTYGRSMPRSFSYCSCLHASSLPHNSCRGKCAVSAHLHLSQSHTCPTADMYVPPVLLTDCG